LAHNYNNLMHCYVIINRWLFPSLLISCICYCTDLAHLVQTWWHLTSILGCFPLDLGPDRSKSDSSTQQLQHSVILKLSWTTHLLPYLCNLYTRHYLYSFRRKPAISMFDWHFTYYSQLITDYCNNHVFGPP